MSREEQVALEWGIGKERDLSKSTEGGDMVN